MESEFNPRSMEWVASKLAPIETCRIVFPQFDLGHEEVLNVGGPFNGIPHLVYATIYKGGHESCRVTAFPAWWRSAE